MLRSLRGLGDTCTPTHCAGPYEVDVYNYDYWLTQASRTGVVQTEAGQQNEAINVTDVQEAMQGGGPAVTYEQLLAAAGVVQCSGGNMDIGQQWACSQANAPRLNAIADLKGRTGGNPSQADLAALLAQFGGTPAYTFSAASSAGPSTSGGGAPNALVGTMQIRGGTLSFSPSRSGGVLQPGDTWTIRISGASPNTAVTVKGGKDGASPISVMGTTDASGNWSLSGTITADSIGSWAETWYVGSAVSGSFSFQVVATPAASGDGPPQPPAPPAPGSGSPSLIPASIESWFTSSMIGDIPNWALALGAVGVGWMLLKGKK